MMKITDYFSTLTLILLAFASIIISSCAGNKANLSIVEAEPSVNIEEITECIVYPEMARLAGIEGKVIVRILLDKSGAMKKHLIEYSDNVILNQSALDAIKNCGKFKPAISNGAPILAWVSIPITFRIRG